MPDRPPKEWFDKTSRSVRQSLKDAHPDWSQETLEERTRETVGDIWYNKMSPEKKQEILKRTEGGAEAAIADAEAREADTLKALADLPKEDDGLSDNPDGHPVSDELNRSDQQDQDRVIPAAASADQKDKDTMKDTMSTLQVPTNTTEMDAKEQTTKERDKLEESEFAYPEERKLPINDAAHVRNALARYNQTDIPSGKKSEVLGRICRAAKKFGIDSDLCKEKGKAEASKLDGRPQFISVPAYQTRYVAAPKFGSDKGEIIVKALVLEEGLNVNGWQVDRSEFPRIAEQYQAGRQLRINHSKDMEDVIGKSFKGSVLKGADVEGYMGSKIAGINPEGLYVAAEFEANPADPQVRTNILQGYVETGSIGLDAMAFCAKCGQPIEILADGSMQRTCHDLEAGVNLKEVETKEYSYVAEPAFSHSIAVPSFAAAVDELSAKLRASSLRATPPTGTALQAQASAEGKKAEADGKSDAEAKIYSQSEADAIADAKMAIYKKGLTDGAKFRADADGGKEPDDDDKKKAEAKADAEGEGKSEADGKANAEGRMTATDQSTRIPVMNAPPGVPRDVLMARVLTPTSYMAKTEPWIREVFIAAANHPRAPAETKRAVKGLFG